MLPLVTVGERVGMRSMALVANLLRVMLFMGASLLGALALDWLVFRRLGWFRGTSGQA